MIAPFPPYFTVDTHNYCNASCACCPYVAVAKTMDQGFMDRDLFIKIADEIAQHRHEVHEVRFGNLAESTMGGERNWWYIKEWVKRGNMLWFYSNMTYLDDAFQERLISIGWNGRIIGHVEEGMGIDLERQKTNYAAALKRFGSDRVRSVNPMTSGPNGLRRFSRDVQIKWRQAHRCTANRPNDTMIIGFDGRVQICCVDSRREVIVGDVSKNSIANVWLGDEFQAARQKLAAGQQDICNNCDWGEN